MNVILGVCCFSILIAFFINNRSGWIRKDNMLLAVTLPEKAFNNQEVIKIIGEYKKANLCFFALMAFIYMPVFLIDMPLVQMFILFFGIALFMVLGSRLIRIYSDRLMALKKKNKWKVINCNTNSNSIECDDYWSHGVYNNPEDKNLMVEKRIGYGQTINLGHKKGKLLNYSTYIFAVTVPLIVFIMISAFEIKTFTLKIEDQSIVIDAPFYGTTINLEDVEEVTLVKDIDITMRTNGASTSRYGIGHFNVTSYGSSRIYAFWENNEYVALKTKGEYIFINDVTKEKTKEYYDSIMEKLKK